MEDFKDRLHTIRQEQNKLLKEYQTLIADYEASDIILENEVLRKKVRGLSGSLRSLGRASTTY